MKKTQFFVFFLLAALLLGAVAFAEEANYTVLYYYENQVDIEPKGEMGGVWEYQLVASEVRSGNSGELAEYDPDLVFKEPYGLHEGGYEVNTAKTVDAEIKADGSTIYRVYYAAKVFQLKITKIPDRNGDLFEIDIHDRFSADLTYMWDFLASKNDIDVLFDGVHMFWLPLYDGAGLSSGGNMVQVAYGLKHLKFARDIPDGYYKTMESFNMAWRYFFETLEGEAPEGKAIYTNTSARVQYGTVTDDRTYWLYEEGHGAGGWNRLITDLDFEDKKGFTFAWKLSDGNAATYSDGGVSRWGVRIHSKPYYGLKNQWEERPYYELTHNWPYTDPNRDYEAEGLLYFDRDGYTDVYYTRNKYQLIFFENLPAGVDDSRLLLADQEIYYEKSLTGYKPSSYVKGETTVVDENGRTHVFDGWYTVATLVAETEFYFDTTMTPYDLHLYAKWTEMTSDLTIAKEVAGAGADETKDFEFSISIPYYAQESLELQAIVGVSATVMRQGAAEADDEVLYFNRGEPATFTLKHGESITIPDFPYDTAYTVTESVPADYILTAAVTGDTVTDDAGTNPIAIALSGNIMADTNLRADTTLTFTNTYQTVDITGSKTWIDGVEAGHINEEEITLPLKRKVENGTPEEMADVENWWDGDSFGYHDLPKYDENGKEYTYTVEEAPMDGYRAEVNGYDITNTAIFTITYDPNGGTLKGSTSPVTETHAYGSKITIADAPEREGYTFLYWQGSEYQPGDEYTVTGKHIFTAQWEENTPEPTEEPKPTPTPTAKPIPAPTATVKPNEFYFSFTKEWRGEVAEDVTFTLYNGTVKHHRLNRTKISDSKWRYEAWLSAAGDYYAVEDKVPGYTTVYQNIGEHADETDRVYNGGTVINSKVPKTGDGFSPTLWWGLALVSLAVIGGLAAADNKRSKKQIKI